MKKRGMVLFFVLTLILFAWLVSRHTRSYSTAGDLVRRNTTSDIEAVICESNTSAYSALEKAFMHDNAAISIFVESLGRLKLKYEKRDPYTTILAGAKAFYLTLKTENESVNLVITTNGELFFEGAKYLILPCDALNQVLEQLANCTADRR